MREFVAARARGDRDAMQQWWGELLTDGWDRLQQLVFFAGRKILSDTEISEAVTEAGMRMTKNVVWRFGGSTTNEFISCMATVAKTSCLEIQRQSATRNKRLRSLDAERVDDGDAAAWSNTVYAAAERKRLELEEDAEREQASFERGSNFLDWALPQLSPKKRAVIERLRAGQSPAAIMEELDMSRDAVDQNKKRGLDDLIALKEQYET